LHRAPDIFAPDYPGLPARTTFKVLEIAHYEHGNHQIPMYRIEHKRREGWVANTEIEELAPSCPG
jgi:hypothetical protein